MKKYPTPITTESFPQAWSYIWRKYGQAKRSLLIGKLVGILGELTFLFGMLFITLGGLYNLDSPSIRAFLESIPYLLEYWDLFSAAVFRPDMIPPVRIILSVLCVYGISIVMCIALTALAYLVYHPITRKPVEDILQNAQRLADISLKAKRYTFKAKNNIATLCGILYLVTIVFVITAVIFLNIDTIDIMAELSAVLPVDNMLAITVLGFIGLAAYSLLEGVFAKIVWLLFYCKISYDLINDAQRFYLFVKDGLFEMDEEQLAEYAQQKHSQARELELSREYTRAKLVYHEAALAGNASAMDDYARTCIIIRNNKEAIYWLQACVNTSKADDVTVKRLKDLKKGRHIRLSYHA